MKVLRQKENAIWESMFISAESSEIADRVRVSLLSTPRSVTGHQDPILLQFF